MVFASWQVGQLFWSMLWFALFFMLIWVVVAVFVDIFRSTDQSGWEKALWIMAIVFLPWLGVLLYLIIRGRNSGDERYVGGYPSGGAWGYGPATTYGPPVVASGSPRDMAP